jgi:hypothetical protein
MSSLVLSGDSSGAVTLTVPAVAGTNTVTIPAGTGTAAVQGVSTNIVSSTTVATTSGTSVLFTGIPSWVKRITIMFNGVKTSGTSIVIIQIGSGSLTTTGYLGTTAMSTSTYNYSTGFGTGVDGAATYVRHGAFRIHPLGSGNIYIYEGSLGYSDSGRASDNGGSVTISGVLDRVAVTTVNGTDTFTAGNINILYE